MSEQKPTETDDDVGVDADGKDGGDKQTVPVDGYRRMRQRAQAAEDENQDLRLQVAELRGRLDGQGSSGANSQTSEPKRYTRTQLRAAVNEGKITEEEMDAVIQRQMEETITDKLSKKLNADRKADAVSQAADIQMRRYKAAVPDLLDKTTDTFAKVKKEWQSLMELGYESDDLRTELLAVKAALGDIDALEKKPKELERETHKETGGRDAETPDVDLRTDGIPKGLSGPQRQHYQRLIENGMYKGWDDPKLQKEMKFLRKRRAA